MKQKEIYFICSECTTHTKAFLYTLHVPVHPNFLVIVFGYKCIVTIVLFLLNYLRCCDCDTERILVSKIYNLTHLIILLRWILSKKNDENLGPHLCNLHCCSSNTLYYTISSTDRYIESTTNDPP